MVGLGTGSVSRELPSPDHRAAAREALSKEISGLFEAFDGSGRKCADRSFSSGPERGSWEAQAIGTVQYTIYVEKLPESSLEFAEDGPARRTFRPAREAALCLDCGAGILDVLSERRQRFAREDRLCLRSGRSWGRGGPPASAPSRFPSRSAQAADRFSNGSEGSHHKRRRDATWPRRLG